MLNDSKLYDIFWTHDIRIDVHILNREKIMVGRNMNPYKLKKGRPTMVKRLWIIGSKCYIKRNDENLGKFDSISNEEFFLGYAIRCKAYKFYNLGLKNMIEIPYVRVDEEFKYRKIDEDDDHPLLKIPLELYKMKKG